MAAEDLTLRMRTAGSRNASRDVDRVSRSVDRVGIGSSRSSKDVGIFVRAINIMRTRAVIATLVVGLLGLAIAAVAPAIVLLTGALIALGALFVPIFLLGMGVMQRFSDTAGIAGSAASELTDVLAAMKTVWNKAISPGAAIVMRGLSKALVTLMPLVEAMRDPLTRFAHAMSGAMQIAAGSFATMGPQIAAMFDAIAPAMDKLAVLMPALFGLFIKAAIAGTPALLQILDWLISFTFWLTDAVGWMDRFGSSASTASLVADVFSVIASAARGVAAVFADLSGILFQVGVALEPLAVLIGGALLAGLRFVAGALDWLNRNLHKFDAIIVPLAATIITLKLAVVGLGIATKVYTIWVTRAWTATALWRVGMIAWVAIMAIATAAQWLFNAALLGNPIVRVISILFLLGAALIAAYHKSATFRGIVDGLWKALKEAWRWSKQAATAVKDGLGAAFQWAADKAQWLWDKLKPVVDVIKKIVEFSAPGLLKKGADALGIDLTPGFDFPGIATGGVVQRGGVAVVGERGPELVDMPRGSRVTPNHAIGEAGPVRDSRPEVVVPVTLLLDGKTVAKSTYRQGVKKASRR